MQLQTCVSTLAAAGIVVFCVWCWAAIQFPEGGVLRIQGPSGIHIDAQLGGKRSEERLPSQETNEISQ